MTIGTSTGEFKKSKFGAMGSYFKQLDIEVGFVVVVVKTEV